MTKNEYDMFKNLPNCHWFLLNWLQVACKIYVFLRVIRSLCPLRLQHAYSAAVILFFFLQP